MKRRYLVVDDEEMFICVCDTLQEARKCARAWAKMLGTAIVQDIYFFEEDDDFTYGDLRETY